MVPTVVLFHTADCGRAAPPRGAVSGRRRRLAAGSPAYRSGYFRGRSSNRKEKGGLICRVSPTDGCSWLG